MNTLRVYRRLIAVPMAAMMIFLTIPYGTVQAAMISTEQAVAAPTSPLRAAAARAHVLGLLERADVQAEMRALGVDPTEAMARVAAMSDGEVQLIANRLEESPAGGDVIISVVGIVVLVFLLLVLTDIFCVTSIFPFTKCIDDKKK